MPQPHIIPHKDGSVRAKGLMEGDQMTGYWEWFRKDGTLMRSGHFDRGEPVGVWITYDQAGQIYKVTQRGEAAD